MISFFNCSKDWALLSNSEISSIISECPQSAIHFCRPMSDLFRSSLCQVPGWYPLQQFYQWSRVDGRWRGLARSFQYKISIQKTNFDFSIFCCGCFGNCTCFFIQISSWKVFKLSLSIFETPTIPMSSRSIFATLTLFWHHPHQTSPWT